MKAERTEHALKHPALKGWKETDSSAKKAWGGRGEAGQCEVTKVKWKKCLKEEEVIRCAEFNRDAELVR